MFKNKALVNYSPMNSQGNMFYLEMPEMGSEYFSCGNKSNKYQVIAY